MKVKITQSCPTLCEPMDCSPPSSSVHAILQVKLLEWVVISFSREFIKEKSQIRRIQLFVQGNLAIRCYDLKRDTGDLITKSRLFSLHLWFSVSASPSNLLSKSNSWVPPQLKNQKLWKSSTATCI